MELTVRIRKDDMSMGMSTATKRLTITFVLLLAIMLSACGQTGEQSDGNYELVFAASTTTGSFYQFCVPCCDIVTRYSDGVTLTAITTTGTKEGFDLLDAGEVQAVGGPGIMEYYAYTGQGGWADVGPVDFSIAYVGYPDYVQIVVPKKSDIESISDLEGKKISVFLMGGTADITTAIIFEALGISDFQARYLDGTDGLSALQDGSIDAMVYTGGLSPSVLMEMAASRNGMKILPFTQDEVDAVEAASDGILRSRTIPAGCYNGEDSEILTVGSSVPICVSNDLPEELVYQIVKTLEEHHDELADTLSAASYSTAANTLENWGDSIIPIHPGAERYFRELGLMD